MAVYYSINDFSKEKWQGSEDIIEGICPVGITLFFAKQKSGKSLLARSLAIAFCNHEDEFLSYKINGNKNLIYFALDDSEKTLHNRFDDLNGFNNFFLVTPNCFAEAKRYYPVHTNAACFDMIVDKIIQKHGPVSLVIVDTLEKIRESDSIRNYAKEVEEISFHKQRAEQQGYNLFFVHHSTQYSNGDPFQNYYGSNGLGAEVDVVIAMLDTDSSEIQRLLINGNNLANAEILVSRDRDLRYHIEDLSNSEIIEDRPHKAYLEIIKFFTRQANNDENRKYEWNGQYQDLITELDLDVDPRSLGKILNKYAKALNEFHITYQTKRKKDGVHLFIKIER